MICINCRAAGDILADGGPESIVRFQHKICEWPESCTCQHSTDPGYVNRV